MRTETKTFEYTDGYDDNYRKFETEVKIVTVKEVFESIKENGFEHLRGSWYDTGIDGKIKGGCVIMQGGLNLNIIASGEDVIRIAPSANYRLTDMLGQHSLQQQLNTIPAPRDGKWYNLETGAGSTIIHWNDLIKYDEEENKIGFVLETYEEVVDMARDVLEPYFDRELTILAYEYDSIKKDELVPA